MPSRFFFCFQPRKTLLDFGNGVRELPLGAPAVGYLSVDWEYLGALACEMQPSNQLFVSSDLYGAIKRQMSAELWELVMIPLLGTASFEQRRPDIRLFEPLLNQIYQTFSNLSRFRADLDRMIAEVFDADRADPALTALQRYYLFQIANQPLFDRLQQSCETVSFQRRITASGRSARPVGKDVTPALIARVRQTPLESRCFLGASDVRALIYMELEEMAAQDVCLKRCANCGGLFVPYSRVSRYCERPMNGTNRRCRDLAAADNYRKKLRTDEVEQLYRKRGNACRMRAKRGVCGESVYEAWKRKADLLRQQVRAGQLSYDGFEEKTRLPKI